MDVLMTTIGRLDRSVVFGLALIVAGLLLLSVVIGAWTLLVALLVALVVIAIVIVLSIAGRPVDRASEEVRS